MSFEKMTFEVDEKAKEKRNALLERLSNHPKIKTFLKNNDCSFDVVKDNALRFEKWLEDMAYVESLSQDELKANPNLGGYVDLYYDSNTQLLMDEYTYVDTSIKQHSAEKHFENYAIFPLHKSLKNANFSDLKLQGETPSYLKAVQQAIAFTQDDTHGLYLYGDLGVGKSYLAACITNRFAKENRSVAFVSPADLLAHLKSNFGSYENDPTLERLKSVDILVIDDLGAEPITGWGRDEVLLPLLNARLENYRKTIFTSNYPPKLLSNAYSLDTRGNLDKMRANRFVDRVLAIAMPIEISGENRRRK